MGFHFSDEILQPLALEYPLFHLPFFLLYFREHGAITIISVSLFGPIGSASVILFIIFFPVIVSILSIKSFAFPNLVLMIIL